jgi:hypothetical protein
MRLKAMDQNKLVDHLGNAKTPPALTPEYLALRAASDSTRKMIECLVCGTVDAIHAESVGQITDKDIVVRNCPTCNQFRSASI